ncbi:MAG: hypothetical protein HUJ67_02770 [Ruminiclostridium sp.]|nr:hypothetical protein [Ruminiclostridium sp.]
MAGSMETIASTSTTAAANLGQMVSTVSIVDTALDTLQDKAKTAIDTVKSVFSRGTQEMADSTQTNCQSMLASFTSAMSQMQSRGASAASSLAATFASTQLRFNSYIPLPHFYMSGSFNAQSRSVPYVGVSWYARAAEEGALFSSPTIIGVGDAREPELLLGENTLRNMIARASADGNSSQTAIEGKILEIMERIASGGIKLGTSGRELALEINSQINSNRRAFG